ncbi:MAG TPA: hypothetical protein VF753_16840 [Terriglobales bacterium]
MADDDSMDVASTVDPTDEGADQPAPAAAETAPAAPDVSGQPSVQVDSATTGNTTEMGL